MQAKEPYYASKRALLCKQKSPIMQAKEPYYASKRLVYSRYKVTDESTFSLFENVSTRRRRNPSLAALVAPSLPSSLNSCSLLEKERAASDERRSCARGRATAAQTKLVSKETYYRAKKTYYMRTFESLPGRVTWWSPSKRRT